MRESFAYPNKLHKPHERIRAAAGDLYQRITTKGKSKKLALIAVSNKLLKQCFAIAKSGHPYDPTFVSV